MKKLVNLKGAKALNKNEQKSINGGARPGSGGGCCDPTFSCCIENPYYNGSNCRFIPGDPYAWPTPMCL